MWLWKAFRRRILPEPVTLKRLAAPLWVFIFGMSALLCLFRRLRCFLLLWSFLLLRLLLVAAALRRRPGPLVGGQDHHHVAAVELWRRFDLGTRRQLVGDPVEVSLAEVGVGHLPPSEHDRVLPFVALVEEVGALPRLGVEVATADL